MAQVRKPDAPDASPVEDPAPTAPAPRRAAGAVTAAHAAMIVGCAVDEVDKVDGDVVTVVSRIVRDGHPVTITERRQILGTGWTWPDGVVDRTETVGK